MNVEISIIEGPLSDSPPPWRHAAAGAIVGFEGIVRPTEDGRPLAALDYEAYRPMADGQLKQLAEAIVGRFHLAAVSVEHSCGRVPVGQCSFRLRIASSHRKEAIQAMDVFIDQLKQDVPIWKKPVYSNGESV